MFAAYAWDQSAPRHSPAAGARSRQRLGVRPPLHGAPVGHHRLPHAAGLVPSPLIFKQCGNTCPPTSKGLHDRVSIHDDIEALNRDNGMCSQLPTHTSPQSFFPGSPAYSPPPPWQPPPRQPGGHAPPASQAVPSGRPAAAAAASGRHPLTAPLPRALRLFCRPTTSLQRSTGLAGREACEVLRWPCCFRGVATRRGAAPPPMPMAGRRSG